MQYFANLVQAKHYHSCPITIYQFLIIVVLSTGVILVHPYNQKRGGVLSIQMSTSTSTVEEQDAKG